MGQTMTNSAFKVKMGAVATTLGLVPEKGAVVFDESQNSFVLGDGINWLAFTTTLDGVALAANGDVFTDILTAGVAVEPAEFFSVVLYNVGSSLTPAIPGQTITINTTGSYRVNYFFNSQSTLPNTTLLFDIAVNGTPLGAPISSFMPKKDTSVSFSGQFVIPGLTATDIITLEIKADKTCTIDRFNQEIGISLV